MSVLGIERGAARGAARTLSAALAFGTMLAGCSGLYYDRRDTIALGAGNAIAANAAEQTVDPWPTYSGNVNFSTNGQLMQSAVERYRTGKITPASDSQTATNGTVQTQAPTSTQVNVTSAPSSTSQPSTASAQTASQ